MSDDGTFAEDDEPMEDLRAAWKQGERGVTKGERDLNRRAKSIVDRAVQEWDSADVTFSVIATGTADQPPDMAPEKGGQVGSTVYEAREYSAL